MPGFAYQNFTHYSIQEAFSKPDELVERAIELGFDGIAITDLHTTGGVVEFKQAIAKAQKKGKKIKGVIGATLRVKVEDQIDHLIVLCQNKIGWHNLMKIISRSNLTDGQDPILFIEQDRLLELLEGLIIIRYKDRPLGNGRPSYYCKPSDSLYQQIIICSKLKRTINDIKDILPEHPEYQKFFDGSDWSLQINDHPEVLELLASIEEFDITAKPKLPRYLDLPSGITSNEYLKELCRQGWKLRGLNIKLQSDTKLKDIYVSRIKHELQVITEAGLSDYMMIVRDFIQYCRSHNQSCGLRGSACGCLISYLIGISEIDPVCPDPTLPHSTERELLFSRFYNWARNVEGNISLCDIDCDLSKTFRNQFLEYVRTKYGKDKTAHIITFMKMDGKAAFKEVCRVLDSVPFQIQNAITKEMVDTAKIQDVLEDMKEDNPKYNSINYCIDEIPRVAEYYKEYKETFDIAMQMANTIRSTGKHAAGMVIANEPLENIVPLVKDPKTNEPLVGLDFTDAEQLGACKYDFLGLATYSKIDAIINMINNNLTEVPMPTEEFIDG